MKRKQRGVTLIELLIAGCGCIGLALFCGGCYVAFHFLAKVW